MSRGDLPEGVSGDRVGAFVEHERLDPQEPELARQPEERIDRLLHGVPHVDHRLDRRLSDLVADVAQHPAELVRPAWQAIRTIRSVRARGSATQRDARHSSKPRK